MAGGGLFLGEFKMKLTKLKKQILFWLIFGLLIRFLMMPFLAHDDFFLIYGRVAKALTGQANFLAYSQPLFHLFHFFGYGLVRIFTPIKDVLVVFVNQDLTNPHTLKIIFLAKLPFVFFEYLSLWLLLKFFQKKDWLKVVIFWLFNPVNLYVLYAFGRFESAVTFILLWFFWLLKRQKLAWASLLFGVLILTRTFFLILIPLYFLLFGRGFREKAKYLLLSLGPFLIWFFYDQFFLKQLQIASLFQEGKHSSYFFESQIGLGLGQVIYLFFLAYALLWLFVWFKEREKEKMFVLTDFLRYTFAVLILYYATSFFHPQYFAWMIPLLAFLVAKPDYKKIVWLLVFLFLPILLFWDNFTTLGLLRPLAEFFNDFSLANWLDKFFPAMKFLNLVRTFFSATGLYLLWLVFKEKDDAFKND